MQRASRVSRRRARRAGDLQPGGGHHAERQRRRGRTHWRTVRSGGRVPHSGGGRFCGRDRATQPAYGIFSPTSDLFATALGYGRSLSTTTRRAHRCYYGNRDGTGLGAAEYLGDPVSDELRTIRPPALDTRLFMYWQWRARLLLARPRCGQAAARGQRGFPRVQSLGIPGCSTCSRTTLPAHCSGRSGDHVRFHPCARLRHQRRLTYMGSRLEATAREFSTWVWGRVTGSGSGTGVHGITNWGAMPGRPLAGDRVPTTSARGWTTH